MLEERDTKRQALGIIAAHYAPPPHRFTDQKIDQCQMPTSSCQLEEEAIMACLAYLWGFLTGFREPDSPLAQQPQVAGQ